MRAKFVLAASLALSAGLGTSLLAQTNPFMLPPYLPKGAMPDSLKIDPPPPAPGSADEARDKAAQKAALKLQGTPRFALAARDADLTSAQATGAFSCAAGVTISPSTTPKTDALLRRSLREFGLASAPTKQKYMRKRPFVVNGKPTCTPKDEPGLRANGSYTSGHSGIGWGWSLVLAQVFPDRTAELVARGRAFGDSRRICNVHWLNDIEQGQVVASAVFARLQSEPAYQADLAAAREEAKALAGQHAPAGCDAEAAALALK
ncbi:phosphatase PAP2 family protein [Novosphingobium sp. TH158]|uniref:acid phosphatase n=1 Tax=Novosphingobium sp. TH158 TaxID=2067455 RepID=UPI000C7A2C23|nr:phosphatase PAP2 family protein [Novosphingobium sp. TH158]PLK26153.1 phosphatase [Novosphingobium sp. TH158]